MTERRFEIENEERLACIYGLGLLETPPEERFERIVRSVLRTFEVPIVYLGLVDRERVWFKSALGLRYTELPLRYALCARAFEAGKLEWVEDARQDADFAQNPLVQRDPFVRFFAACPLEGPHGWAVGTLAMLDRRVRVLSKEEEGAYLDFAKWASYELSASKIQLTQAPQIDSETRMRAVLNNVRDGIITINFQGQIESFNPAAERLFGYRKDEIVGENIMSLIEDPTAAQDEEAKRKISSRWGQHADVGGELTGRRKDGSTFSMELSINDMWLGSHRMFTAIVRDITERKKLDRIKNEFISMVSHELRTPLTSIHGALGLLKAGVVGELPQKVLSMIEIAHKNSERLVRLINDILDIEKIESGKMNFRMSYLALMPCIEQTMEANEAYAKQLQISLALIHAEPDVVVYVDGDRLIQVLTNLISNAAKFSSSGQQVDIAVRRQGAKVRVSVQDRGSGIEEEFQPRIFEKFAQADTSTTRVKGGSGLGLSICKAIIERMDGTIGYQTKAGEGTTFYFDLPAFSGSD